MATVKIDFSDLETASRRAQNVATEMNDYASTLTRTMSSVLSDIEGGSSSYTSAVLSLAQEKARSLRARATRYNRLSGEIDAFIVSARSADKSVKRRLDQLADKRADDLKWWQRVGYDFFKFFNGIFGDTKMGAFLNNMENVVNAMHEGRKKIEKDIYEWFRYGDGRYVLEIIGKAVTVVVAVLAIAKVVAAMIATFPASLVISALMIGAAVAGGLATIKKISDLFVTSWECGKAIVMNDTEPGQARYYGSTTDLSTLARRETTNESFQNVAKVLDTVGVVADIVFSVLTLGLTEKFDQPVFDFSKDTLKDNLFSKIGFEYNPNSKGFVFSMENALGYEKFDHGSVSNIVDSLKNVTRFGEEGLVKGISSTLSNVFPGIDALGYADKVVGAVR